MATVQSIIDSARYDLVDFVDGAGVGIEFDDTELLDYLNRMVGLMDSQLSALQSDQVEAKDESIDLVSGQSYMSISGLNSGLWNRLRSVWIESRRLEQVSLDYMRYTSMFRSGNAVPSIWSLYGNQILLPQGATAPTELMPNAVDRTFSAASAWTDVDLAVTGAYDETDDLSLLAGAAGAGDYCTLAVASAPTTVGSKYRMLYDLSGLVGSWYVKDFTGAQTIGTISADATQGYLDWTAEYSGGYRLVAVSHNAAGDFDNFKLYLRSDNNVTIFYDKKSSALTLAGDMPYSDRFNEFFREMLVMTAKAKKEGIIDRADSLLNEMFRSRAMTEEIQRGFIPRPYVYWEF
jgi:hypothetical protein